MYDFALSSTEIAKYFVPVPMVRLNDFSFSSKSIDPENRTYNLSLDKFQMDLYPRNRTDYTAAWTIQNPTSLTYETISDVNDISLVYTPPFVLSTSEYAPP